MQLIKKKKMLNLIGAYKDLLSNSKEAMLLRLTRLQPFMGVTKKAELEKIVHKPPKINPNMIAPSFQPSMYEKIRQFSR